MNKYVETCTANKNGKCLVYSNVKQIKIFHEMTVFESLYFRSGCFKRVLYNQCIIMDTFCKICQM